MYLLLIFQVHQKAAEKLLKLCQLNKGVYIKVGQHIGALDYVLPSEYVNTMKVLHSQAPASTIEEVYKVFKEDLKRDVSLVLIVNRFSHQTLRIILSACCSQTMYLKV